MPLTEDYVRWLEDLFTITDNHPKVSPWERKFLDDHKSRYEEQGPNMSLSPKQRAVLMKIEEKVTQ